MTRLTALRLFNYPSGTRRRLKPGEEFDVAQREVDGLVRTGLAKLAEEKPDRVIIAKTSYGDETNVRAAPGAGLTTLRNQYEEFAGHPPDMRWGTERLRREIETARLSYQRRDMRAED